MKHPLAELERGVGLRKQRIDRVAAHLCVKVNRKETWRQRHDKNGFGTSRNPEDTFKTNAVLHNQASHVHVIELGSQFKTRVTDK